MNNLLKFEFRKLFRQKIFYIISIIIIAISLLSFLSCYLSYKDALSDPEYADRASYYVTTGLEALLLAVMDSDLLLLIGIFEIIFLVTDYTDGTMKNIISRGFTRDEVYFAKYIVAIVSALLLTLICFIVNFLPYFFVWGAGNDWDLEAFEILGTQILIVIAYASFACFISMAVRKSGTGICALLGSQILVTLVVAIIDLIISLEFEESTFSLYPYWLMHFLDGLTYSTSEQLTKNMTIASIGSVCYTMLFAFLGWVSSFKREIK